MIHDQPSPLAGKTVTIVGGRLAGQQYWVEDWWDRVAGKSWMNCDGNPFCLEYAIGERGSPIDDEVVYGKVAMFGALVHVTHIDQDGDLAR